MMRQVRMWSRASWTPLIMPQISVELLVSCPRFSAVMLCILPRLSLVTTPAPEGRGFPFEGPSKLIFWKRGGGEDQIEGLVSREEGGGRVGEKFEESFRSQELRIRSSAGSEGWSYLVQGCSWRVS
jgi:hypothetical protein